jgi:hypothetical protein
MTGEKYIALVFYGGVLAMTTIGVIATSHPKSKLIFYVFCGAAAIAFTSLAAAIPLAGFGILSP